MQGKVTFGGKVPEPVKIDNSICKHAEPIADESVLVGPGGGLANVLVSIVGVRSAANTDASPQALDQKNCQFVPHVIVVRAGEAMLIKNSDAEAHNVHGTPSDNPAFNVALATAGSSKDFTLTKPEVVRVK